MGRVRCVPGEALLQFLFSAFPGGLPGMSLLVMRAVLGIAMILEGGSYFGAPGGTVTTLVAGASAVIAGGLLLAGFFTPFTALVLGLNLIGLAVAAIPAPTPNLFDSQPALIFGLTMIVALIGVGPGRYSVDARVFGRREIIIPLRNRP
jgi:uncharacterized membrane protein YphA (DoxX/SURF4 family)